MRANFILIIFFLSVSFSVSLKLKQEKNPKRKSYHNSSENYYDSCTVLIIFKMGENGQKVLYDLSS